MFNQKCVSVYFLYLILQLNWEPIVQIKKTVWHIMLNALQEYVRVKRFTTQKVGDVKQVRVSLFISYKQYTHYCFICTLFGSFTFHENSKALSSCV